jgi:hypothetical protein
MCLEQILGMGTFLDPYEYRGKTGFMKEKKRTSMAGIQPSFRDTPLP